MVDGPKTSNHVLVNLGKTTHGVGNRGEGKEGKEVNKPTSAPNSTSNPEASGGTPSGKNAPLTHPPGSSANQKQGLKMVLPWGDLLSGKSQNTTGQPPTSPRQPAEGQYFQAQLANRSLKPEGRQQTVQNPSATRNTSDPMERQLMEARNPTFGKGISGFTWMDETFFEIQQHFQRHGVLGFFRLAWFDPDLGRPASVLFSVVVNLLIVILFIVFMAFISR